MRNQIK